jgi:hypothetical protein
MATTTNYGWTTPDDTALVKDGAAAIRTLGSSVDTTTKNLNPETTLGDIAYRSSTANVKTRLGLGTAGQVLTVNSGATAPEWAAIPAGGGLTSLASGSLSSSSLDLTSISSSYKHLQIVFRNLQVSNSAEISFRLNNISSSDYDLLHTFADTTQAILASTFNAAQLRTTYNQVRSGVTTSLLINIWDYTNTTSHKQVQLQYQGQNSVPRLEYNTTIGACKTTDAINRFTLNLNTGTFTAGTYILYGVN